MEDWRYITPFVLWSTLPCLLIYVTAKANKSKTYRRQGRINRWANLANARGLALEYQNTPLLVFHMFRLFTTRQNYRVF